MQRLAAPAAIVVLGFALACAPVYNPAAANFAMLDKRGDLNVEGGLGVEGLQLSTAYAATDHLEVRGLAQVSRIDDNRYDHLAVGVGGYFASPEGLRISVDYDIGPTRALGVYESTRLSGMGLKQSVSLGIGMEQPNFAIGVVSRPGLYTFWHDAQSSREGTSWMSFDETSLVLRVGSPRYKFEAQAGVWIPFEVSPDVDIGVPFPFVFGLGFSADFPTAELREQRKQSKP